MTWVRLDDNFHGHPKVAPLSDAAYRLYVGALCYSNRYSTGGRMVLAQARTLVQRNPRGPIAELVMANLWTCDGPDCWLIHDYFLYQPDPAKQRAGQAGGQASATARAQADAAAEFKPRTRPVPVSIGVENPSVGSPVENPDYGVPPTHMHVSGMAPLSGILRTVRLQPTPREAAE